MSIVLLFLLAPAMYGMLEMTRAVQVKADLATAVRTGCRVAIRPGSANSDVLASVNAALSAEGLTANAVTTIRVNGQAADVKNAVAGDQVTVTVSVPLSEVAWVIPRFMPGSATLAETLVMMRQG
jgi:hypothetical protein